ncbi:tRNA delta(2)-isopentenylpyrophosphatetransferase [Secundilactobacillus oryzae JCM 18671]|uniref:tRNA dimethylallyltransferase n=1 Tax=Secundilactobacillus oryzae JCM 18671 TaxID=1291743 RepID=A0A081BFY5_9LACO|nr:tRNA (adenosine(37)-N6)-dimethylallyltransferase MiaA [Secundilactobacillus oryzae]GAK46953.1 tRNA delta(2)-isopentenylpyrophosphatetransferase [Secundilactobacillus oryzae JCM 18671]
MEKILIIAGPTAVGKTALSIELAKQYDGEIVSGDSMQVYRGLDIGTAKVTTEEQQGISHHLIDVRNFDERFSVADFVQLSSALITDIHARHKLPIIAGGTGFYLSALVDGLTLGGDEYDQDEAIRVKWRNYLQDFGEQELWNQLAAVDAPAAQKIPVSNSRRIIRALEVYERTGQRFSDQTQAKTPQYDALIVGLTTERSLLYERINQRVDLMIKAGLIDEAYELYERGGFEFQSGRGIGYKEFAGYFEGHQSLKEAVEKIKLDSRHYAKRQLTWFRNKMTVNWFDLIQNPEQKADIEGLIAGWL